MKCLAFILSFFCLIAIGFSQPTYLDNYVSVPQSPEASEFQQYSEIPVSLQTGIPNISVPLFSMESDYMSIPLSMSYHSDGIKVGEIAPWTGMGWSLNVGGSITRQVRDQPDDAYHIDTDIHYCSDLYFCKNCEPCENNTTEDCEICVGSGAGFKILNHQDTDIGYLYNGSIVQGLVDKDWQDFTDDDNTFLFGQPNEYAVGLTFSELNLNTDIILDIDMDFDMGGCEDAYCDWYQDQQNHETIAAVGVLVGTTGVQFGLPAYVVGALLLGLSEVCEPYDGEDLPHWTLDEAIALFDTDCLLFDVARPIYNYKDSEPDLFSFNVNGHSGTFMFDKNGEPKLFSDSDLKIDYTMDMDHQYELPGQSTIQFNSIYKGAITEFIITDTEGIQYVFQDGELSFSNGENQQKLPQSFVSDHLSDENPGLHIKNPYRIDFENVSASYSSWKLTEIRVAQRPVGDPSEFIFTYEDELLLDHSHIVQTVNHTPGPGNQYSSTSSVSSVFKKRLKEVIWKKGGKFSTGYKLELSASPNRPDYYYPSEITTTNLGNVQKACRLDDIKLTRNGNLLQVAKLEYDLFPELPLGTVDPSISDWVTAHSKRLRLHKITLGGMSEEMVFTQMPPYIIDYNDNSDSNKNLPPRHSAKRDFWGYHNGTSLSLIPDVYAYPPHPDCTYYAYNNECDFLDEGDSGECHPAFTGMLNDFNSIYQFLPLQPVPNLFQNDMLSAYGDRRVYEDYAKEGVLKKITYPTGGSSEFDFESNRMWGGFRFDPSVTDVNGEVLVGGLRIKNLTNSEGVDKSYEYQFGSVVELPLFAKSKNIGQILNGGSNDGSVYHNTTISSESYNGLIQTQGANLIYTNVKEIFADQSYNSYGFGAKLSNLGASSYPIWYHNEYDCGADLPRSSCIDNSGCLYEMPDFFTYACSSFPDFFPFPPRPNYDWKRGKLVRKNSYSNTDDLIQSEKYEYELFCAEKIHGIKSLQIAGEQEENLIGLFLTSSAKYYHIASDYRLTKIITTLDGVISEKTLSYNTNKDFHQVAKESIVNSDGSVYDTEYKYSYEDVPGGIGRHLFAQNRIVPLEIKKSKNGVQYAGSKYDYAWFNSSLGGNGEGPFLSKVEQYEKGTLGPGTYEPVLDINSYRPLIGKPSKITPFGWQPVSYTYSSTGKATSQIFGSFVSTYEYYPFTDNLIRKTDSDGISAFYHYDGLGRMNQSKTREGTTEEVVTNITYAFGPNEITSTAQMDFGLLTTVKKMDGLGRLVESVFPDGSITTQTYNNRGKLSTINDPITGLTTNHYYADPLARPQAISHNNNLLGFTSFTYGSGTTPLSGINNVYVSSQIDADGNAMIAYKDILGRSLCISKGGADLSTHLHTVNEYDPKGRLTRVHPPASYNQAGMNYHYVYDGDDNVLVSSFPEQASKVFHYDDRNLPIAMKNGLIGSNKGWLNTSYDPYGRILQTGFGTTVGSISEELTRTEYLDPNFITLPSKQIVQILDGFDATGGAIETEMTYDAVKRIVSSSSNNALLGIESIAYTYDDADNILTETKSTNGITTFNNNNIDAFGRLDEMTLGYFGTIASCDFNYSVRDQIDNKVLGGGLQTVDYNYLSNGWLSSMNAISSINNPIQLCDNVPGAPYVGSGTDPLLHMNFRYNNPDNSGVFARNNGNISEINWTVKGGEPAYYGYVYDEHNRLTNAISSIDASDSKQGAFDTSYTYDERGNLLTLKRRGLVFDGKCYRNEPIDDLIYNYKNSGNSNQFDDIMDGVDCCPDYVHESNPINQSGSYGAEIKLSSDAQPDSDKQIDFRAEQEVELQAGFEFSSDGTGTFIGQAADCPSPNLSADLSFYSQMGFLEDKDTNLNYVYDANGNIIQDPNKGILINYNHKNLPFRISDLSGSVLMEWIYTASGQKLQKQSFLQTGTETKSYYGNVEFNDNGLEAIYFAEGRISNDPNGLMVEYFLKDHLGNTRLTFADKNNNGTIDMTSDPTTSEVLQENHYYPFGMNMSGPWKEVGSSANDYKYNGKELNQDFGLNWMYYGARFYDAAIGRFPTMDPLADHPNQVDKSTYAYVWNNPIKLTDPDGKCPDCPHEIYLDLAGSVYNDQVGDIGVNLWKAESVIEDPSTGYKAIVYVGLEGSGFEGERILATAGTNDFEDIKQDGSQVSGVSTQYRQSAMHGFLAAKAYPGISFTGHSLGGGEATVNAILTNGKAVTFNSAGVSIATRKSLGLFGKNAGSITAYVVEGEILNASQGFSLINKMGVDQAQGEWFTLPNTVKKTGWNRIGLWNRINRHKMGAVRDGWEEAKTQFREVTLPALQNLRWR